MVALAAILRFGWWLLPLFPLLLALAALRLRREAFLACCRLGLTRTGAALLHGVVAVAALAAGLILLVRWVRAPHGPGAPYALFFIGAGAAAGLSLAFIGQSIALVVVGTLARRAPLEERPYLAAVIGFLVLTAVGLIPEVGKTLTLVMSSLGLGCVALRLRGAAPPGPM